MESDKKEHKPIPIQAGNIVAVYGYNASSARIPFYLTTPNENAEPEIFLDFESDMTDFREWDTRQTIHGYISSKLDGKLKGQTTVEDWAEAFGLLEYFSTSIEDLPLQAVFRLRFFEAVARPVEILRITNTENIQDFSTLLLDVKRFFRVHKLPYFCPGFVIEEERESFMINIVADGIVNIKKDVLAVI